MTQTPRSSVGDNGPATSFGASTSGAVDQAQEKVSQVVDQVQGVAGQVTQQVEQQATSQLSAQKDRAVDSFVTVAQALRQTGQTLQQQEQPVVAGYVEQVAQRVESMTNYLRARDIPELVEETQNLARRQPGLFVTGALALGFVGARFLMTSGQRARAQRGSTEVRAKQPGAGAPAAYGTYPTRPPEQAATPRYPASGSRTGDLATPSGTLGVDGGLDV